MTAWIEKFSSGEGTSIAIKDSIDVAGCPTRLGSAAEVGTDRAGQDAELVTALNGAGFHIAGKVVLHELAFGMTGVNLHSGTPENPKYPDFITGGSSSGSASVVASGEVEAAIGTDTGGSVRVPAACCGVYGFKPSFGRVSRKGVWPAESSLDCVGAFAQNIETLSNIHQVLDPDLEWGKPSESLNELAIGFYSDTCSDQLVQEIQAALNKAGVKSSNVNVPHFDEAFHAGMTLIGWETYSAYQDLEGSELLGEDVRQRLSMAKNITASAKEEAEQVRERFTRSFDELLQDFPLLITPALPDLPLKRSEALDGKQDLNISRFVRPFNLSGHPALVVPLNNTALEGPVALQLVARRDQDAWLFSVAKQLIERLSSN